MLISYRKVYHWHKKSLRKRAVSAFRISDAVNYGIASAFRIRA
jgi:hypothetical protein